MKLPTPLLSIAASVALFAAQQSAEEARRDSTVDRGMESIEQFTETTGQPLRDVVSRAVADVRATSATVKAPALPSGIFLALSDVRW